MNSALYTGLLRHRRFAPRSHVFSYRLFMVYLDLAELDDVFRGRWLWSTRRPTLAWLRRADYLGDRSVSIDAAVRDLVCAETGVRPVGPVRMLTHLRYFGLAFNPVTFYYCFDPTGTRVETVVAEVTNTPWNERHAYVLDRRTPTARDDRLRFRFDKLFHVSPFMPMTIDYDWRFGTPGERLAVHMENHEHGHKTFDATLDLVRRPISARTLAATLFAFPLMTATVVTGIYWQALRLWLKRVPFHLHPARVSDDARSASTQ